MGNLSNFVKRVRDIMRNDAGINGDAQRIEQIAWMLFLKVYDAKEDDWEWNEKDYQSIIPEPCRWRSWAHDENGKGITGDTLLEFVNNTLFPTLKKLPVDASTAHQKSNRADYLCRCQQLYERWCFAPTSYQCDR